jgi:hypothetical protein
MTRPAIQSALFALLMTPLACNKEQPAPAADAGAAPASAAATDKDPLADVPTEADYEEQADLSIDKNNFVDRLDELEKEIDAPDPR